jgi:CNT family concentrative nucleoside transporter
MEYLRAGLGLGFFVVLGWLLSTDRKAVSPRIVLGGLLTQILLALLILKTPWGRSGLDWFSAKVTRFLLFGEEGAHFVFGDLTAGAEGPAGWILAFKALPIIIFFSAFMAVLYHLGIMQVLIGLVARLLRLSLRVSGAESLAMAANVFAGQTEAPLVIRPYIDRLTRSELMALMTGGFATIAGSVLAAYVGILGEGFAGHLLAASFMSAPAAFVMAKLLVPETEEPVTKDAAHAKIERSTSNLLDAAAQGTQDGLKLYLNVVAMLIAFVGLVHAIDWPLSAIGPEWTLQALFGKVFWPVAFLMGVTVEDCAAFGSLLGTKVAVTEFVAYGDLKAMMAGSSALTPRSQIMAAYALCGFANFASIGIQIGGIAALAPSRRADLSRIALRAMLAGACASWMTATIAGAFLPLEQAS